MRLIDADEFIKKFRYASANTEEEKIMCATVRKLIKEQPTAYDIDKVVDEIYNKAIDDFAKALCKAFNDTTIIESGYFPNNVVRLVAGEMREAVKNNGMDSM